MTAFLSRRTVPLVVATVVGLTVLISPGASATPSQDALIAEVYGGGGNSGATLTQDFVELANASSAPVTLDGWSVQYLPAAPSPTSRWQVTPLAGAVPPGSRYLIAQAKGSGGTVALPTPDAAGSISMAAGAGTVALVDGTTALTCLTATDCAADPRVRDLVGYGNALVREATPTAATSSSTSAARRALTDTDDNSADFAVGPPSPVNGKGEGPGQGGGDPVAVTIPEIQGTTRVSPYAGKQVTGVRGIVVAVRTFGSSRGFWLHSPISDDDPRTSEGLFAFTGSQTPAVRAGDLVELSGQVKEYYPDNPASSAYQSVTELVGPQWIIQSSGNPLPQAQVIGESTIPSQLAPGANGGNIEALALLPDTYALDFWESREGMPVRIDNARVIGPSNRYNELYVTTKPNENATARGGTVYLGYDRPNTGRLKVQSLTPLAQRPFLQANVGDTLAGETSGVVDYASFGGYTLQATTLGDLVAGGTQPETTRRQRSGELAVATYNVENLDPADDQVKFDRLAAGIVHRLSTPDILALEEIQDDNGATDDGTVSAGRTLRRLTDAVVAAGGPRYEWRQIDPVNKQDGGEPGGNIRVGFLFNPQRVSFVDRPGGDATTPVKVVARHGRPHLSISPGRVDPANPAWDDSRKPLVGEFVFHGRTVFVVANHFNSKGGDQPMHGRYQPPNRGSEIQRLQQAVTLRAFVDQLLRVDARANVIVAGDLNDYQFSPALRKLTEGGVMVDLVDTLPEAERYGYVYEGNSQVLDHILTSRAPRGVDYDVVHTNAEFRDQVSDHDPQVVRLRPSTGVPALDELLDLLDLLERRTVGSVSGSA